MAELPSGTVTFLFTDVEGSTRLWEQEPDAMRSALALHDTVSAWRNRRVWRPSGEEHRRRCVRGVRAATPCGGRGRGRSDRTGQGGVADARRFTVANGGALRAGYGAGRRLLGPDVYTPRGSCRRRTAVRSCAVRSSVSRCVTASHSWTWVSIGCATSSRRYASSRWTCPAWARCSHPCARWTLTDRTYRTS